MPVPIHAAPARARLANVVGAGARVTQDGVQVPEAHARAVRQSLPQAPQLVALSRSTHCPPQRTCPATWQPGTQALPEQTMFAPAQSASLQHWKHAIWLQQTPPPAQVTGAAHDPPEHTSVVQPLASLQSLSPQQARQSAPQSRGVAGAHAQALDPHAAPALHACVQAPQCDASLVVSVSQPSSALPSQSPKPTSHAIWPAWQCWCASAAWVQLPQWAGSLVRSTHDAPQRLRPPVQPATHFVPSHSAVGFVQVVPHVPQLVALDFEASHPTLGGPLQWRWPASQAQVPPAHTMLGPHALVQAPQVWALVRRDASQPFTGFASQSAKPVAQPHAPFAHASLAPHATVQLPQCAASVAG
jgi:hypothetical protein